MQICSMCSKCLKCSENWTVFCRVFCHFSTNSIASMINRNICIGIAFREMIERAWPLEICDRTFANSDAVVIWIIFNNVQMLFSKTIFGCFFFLFYFFFVCLSSSIFLLLTLVKCGRAHHASAQSLWICSVQFG